MNCLLKKKKIFEVVGFSEKNPQIKKYHLESWQFYKLAHKTIMLKFFTSLEIIYFWQKWPKYQGLYFYEESDKY